MREIEFRGKSVEHNMWVYGYYIKAIGSLIVEKRSSISTMEYVVDENSIGQFTGLRDKNGIKIYDGDIIEGTIRSQWVKEKIKCQVMWNKDGWISAEPSGEDYWAHKVLFGKDCIVIGNIYDNPGLLEDEYGRIY